MARPTTWRRSWGTTVGLSGSTSIIDLLVVQPGETLSGVWWTYRLWEGPLAANVYRPRSSTTIVALGLVQDGDPNPSPLADGSTFDWLWWEPVQWDNSFTSAADNLWMFTAAGPKIHRKAETARRAPAGANSTLSVFMQTDEADSSAGFVNDLNLQVAASALIILP